MVTKITKTKTFTGTVGLKNTGLDYFDEKINEFCSMHEVVDIKFAVHDKNIFAMIFYKEEIK